MKKQILERMYRTASCLEGVSRIAERYGDYNAAVFNLWKSLKIRVEAEFVQCNFIVNNRDEIHDLLYSLYSLTDCHDVQNLMKGTTAMEGFGLALEVDSEGEFKKYTSAEYGIAYAFKRKMDAYREPINLLIETGMGLAAAKAEIKREQENQTNV